MMTIVLAEHYDKPIDVLKVLKMVLIYDIVEIDAGDTFIYDITKNNTMDRFEPLLQNTSNNGGAWAEFNVPYQKVYDKKKEIKKGSAILWSYAENLINESVDKGI